MIKLGTALPWPALQLSFRTSWKDSMTIELRLVGIKELHNWGSFLAGILLAMSSKILQDCRFTACFSLNKAGLASSHHFLQVTNSPRRD